VQGVGLPGNHIWVFSRWCSVSGGEEGWEGGFPTLGGAFPSFTEVVRSKGLVKLQILPVEWCELDFLPVVET